MRSVTDDLDGFVFLSLFHEAYPAERVEELGGDLGKNTGTLEEDAVADQKEQEPGEELVHVIRGVELRELIEKIGGKVVRVLLGARRPAWRKQRPELVPRQEADKDGPCGCGGCKGLRA